MVSNFVYKNFKAFEQQGIELRPLTFILGPNNSGKSSLLAGLRILSQTATCYDPNVTLLLNGALGDFGTYKDVVFGNNIKRHIEISTSLSARGYPRPVLIRPDAQVNLFLRYTYRSSLREIVLHTVEIKIDNQHLLTVSQSQESDRPVLTKILGNDIGTSIRTSVSRDVRLRNFLPHIYLGFSIPSKTETQTNRFYKTLDSNLLRSVNPYSNFVSSYLSGIEYVGAMRMPPSRTYTFSGERRQKIGASGENAPSILAMDISRKGSRTKNIKDRLLKWLTKAGIASDLKIELLSDRYFELKIQHPITKEYQNLADVGYGNSQVLPVLVGGYNLTPGQIYIVEEPEIHLHPRAQSELGDFFSDLYNARIQCLVETHSEYLILRMQQLIAQKIIKPEDVVVYYVHAKESGKCVTALHLDQKGKFTTEWPEGFFPERLNEAKKLAQLRHLNQDGTNDE